jgi:uncharacterized membrane protein YesL
LNRLWQFSSKEGPGIAKDAPPKTGLALLLDVVARNWWELIQLNLLVILFSLPLVTAPAAILAAMRICVLMLEDRNVYLGRDFLDAFRQRFWKAMSLGFVAAAVIGLSGYVAFIFFQAARTNVFLALPLTVSASTGVFALIATSYAFSLLAMRDQPLTALLKQAMLGALARPLPALAALAFVGLLWLLHVVFYPVSIFMPAVVNFSFGTLAVTFGVHKAAARLLALEKGAGTGGAYAEGSA